MEVHRCDLPGRRRSEKCGEAEAEGKKANDASWRKSTLLRSGRQTKPPKRPDEAAFEDLDDAFQPVVRKVDQTLPSSEHSHLNEAVDGKTFAYSDLSTD